MRIALIQITQESNTFAPGATGLDAFEHGALVEGQAVVEGDVGRFMAGILGELCQWPDPVELVPIIRAAAVPGPPLAPAAVAALMERMTRRLRSAGPVDGVVLIVHGACVTADGHSADAMIASAVRDAVDLSVPITAGLDHHGHVTQTLIDTVDALVGHRTQPHDPADTGARAAGLLRRILFADVRPVVSWRRLPMVTHQEQYVTAGGPMGEWFARARGYESSSGVESVSLFPMQPWLDIPDAGWSVVVVADGAASDGIADSVADDLADAGWELRHEFMVRGSMPIAEAVAAAVRNQTLTLISDLGDSVFGGAPGDSTVLLEALLVTDLPGPALVPLLDPAAVAACDTAPIGTPVDLTVGLAAGTGRPVRLSGRVSGRADGVLRLPGFGHERADYGRCVLIESGQLRLMLTERRGVSGNHPAAYERLGVDVGRARLAVVKTAANIYGFAGYGPLHVQADTPGPTQSDVATLPWKRLTRPIFPLDERDDWRWHGAVHQHRP